MKLGVTVVKLLNVVKLTHIIFKKKNKNLKYVVEEMKFEKLKNK